MKIQLSHYEFDLTARYASGSVINEAEAKALNVMRGERIRNRVAAWLRRADPDGRGLHGEKLAEMYAWVARVDQNFEFDARHGPKPKLGTLQGEARDVAQEWAQERARASGRANDETAVGQFFDEIMASKASELLDEAAKRIEARRAVVASGLEDL